MLKGIDPLLGPELLALLRAMGHGDEIAIVDGNYPADAHGQRVVRADGFGSIRVAEAILSVMPLDDFVEHTAFRPAGPGHPDRPEPIFEEFQAVVSRFEPKVKVEPLVGNAFYDRVRNAYAIVATSEPRLYGNLILRKGVIYPS